MLRTIHDMIEDPRTPAPAVARLSARELEVLLLVGACLTNEEITRELGLSINTVKSYIRTAYAKVGVTTRARATAWVYGHRSALESALQQASARRRATA